MRTDVAQKFFDAAYEVARIFSDPNRQFNRTKEIFRVNDIRPFSETTGCVIYDKSSGKKAVCFFYYLNSEGGHWRYFLPTDSHVLGMLELQAVLKEVEEYNFGQNDFGG